MKGRDGETRLPEPDLQSGYFYLGASGRFCFGADTSGKPDSGEQGFQQHLPKLSFFLNDMRAQGHARL